jgi:hypothetical protein
LSQQINLFNPIFLKQKKIFASMAMAQALLVLLVGTLALGYYGSLSVGSLQKAAGAASARLAKEQARQVAATTEFVPRARSPQIEQQLAVAELELASLKNVALVLKRGDFGNTSGYAEYFKALARQNVGGLWLTGVSIIGAGNEIGVQGRALQPSLVPNFIGRLTRESVMRGKAFDSLRIDQPMQKAKKAKDGSGAESSEPTPFVEFNLQSGVAAAPAVPGEPHP